MKLRRLHVAGALIILAWLASLGWLVRREYFGRTPGEVSASARVAPGAVFFAIYLGGQQIGTGATTVDTLADSVRISGRADVLLPDGNAGRRIRTTTEVRLGPSLALTSFQSIVAGDAPGVSVLARRADGGLNIRLRWPGLGEVTRSARASALPHLAVPVRAVADGPLEEGRRIEYAIIDPLSGAVRPMAYIIGSQVSFVVPDSAVLDSGSGLWIPAHMDTVPAWSLESEDGSLESRMWIDQQGFIVRAEMPNGWTIIRTAFEIAQLNLRAGRPHRSRSSRPLVYTGRGSAPPVVGSDTAAAPLIPSDSQAIVALVSRLAPDSLPPEARARALFDHVARRIVPGEGAPDAVSALREGRGSAASRALLLAALARAAGIPARSVSGARFASGEWRPDVWVALHLGEWIDVDPVRRTWPADSLRFPFRIDGSGHPLEVLAPTARLLRPRIPESSGRTP